jgi:hypothetical protein
LHPTLGTASDPTSLYRRRDRCEPQKETHREDARTFRRVDPPARDEALGSRAGARRVGFLSLLGGSKALYVCGDGDVSKRRGQMLRQHIHGMCLRRQLYLCLHHDRRLNGGG